MLVGLFADPGGNHGRLVEVGGLLTVVGKPCARRIGGPSMNSMVLAERSSLVELMMRLRLGTTVLGSTMLIDRASSTIDGATWN